MAWIGWAADFVARDQPSLFIGNRVVDESNSTVESLWKLISKPRIQTTATGAGDLYGTSATQELPLMPQNPAETPHVQKPTEIGVSHRKPQE